MLPVIPIQLFRTNQTDDPASMSIVHNKNMTDIELYLGQIIEHVNSNGSGGSGSITQEQFTELMNSHKSSAVIQVDLATSAFIDFNDYRLTKIGPMSGKPLSMEFRITDTNLERNTNFRNSVLVVKTFSGETVYPTVVSTLTWISIQFELSSEVEATTGDPTTDPNNKRILLL